MADESNTNTTIKFDNVPGEYKGPETTSEQSAYSTLVFLSEMKGLWPTVTFKDRFGDAVRIETEELHELSDLDDFDRDAFLSGKAHEIACGTDFVIRLTDPDKPEGNPVIT